jgi:poly(ADP-ribose) glycohydrolase ARH3
MNQIDLRSKFLGGMVGSALGDAIGELAFRGLGEAVLRAAIGQKDVLVYTDDTAMAIGLAESITQVGRLDEQHLGETFRANFQREPWRGYASGPPTVFSLVKRRGMSYSEAARSLFGGQGSFGNGAAMRIAPVGLCYYDSPDLYEQARVSASVTHAHPIGVDGAAVLAWAVAQAVKLDPQEPFPFEPFSQGLTDFARTPEIRDKMVLVRTLMAKDVPPPDAARCLGRSVAVHESMPFAVYAFLRHPQSFEACLFCAILHGGDRDTLGAMACAVSGAYLGVDAIPPAWREKLENRKHIEDLADKLVGMKNTHESTPMVRATHQEDISEPLSRRQGDKGAHSWKNL